MCVLEIFCSNGTQAQPFHHPGLFLLLRGCLGWLGFRLRLGFRFPSRFWFPQPLVTDTMFYMITIEWLEAERLLAAATQLVRALQPLLEKPEDEDQRAIDDIVYQVAVGHPDLPARALHRTLCAQLRANFFSPFIGERDMGRRLLRMGFTKKLGQAGTFWVAPNAAPSPANETT